MSAEHSALAGHTATPWRVGDAGLTVFGPKTDAPSPKTVAHSNRADAAYIVRCVNSHEALVSALLEAERALIGIKQYGDEPGDMPEPLLEQIGDALASARGE